MQIGCLKRCFVAERGAVNDVSKQSQLNKAAFGTKDREVLHGDKDALDIKCKININ